MQIRGAYEREVLNDYNSKIISWIQEIEEVEMNRFTKPLQDFEGHENLIYNE